MTANFISIGQKATSFVLSVPVQATLYLWLCSLVVWTIFFSTYPAVHNPLHSLRHHTLTVSCH